MNGLEDEQAGGMSMFDRITFEPRILGGRAAIRGMRIPVSVIVGQIAYGATHDEVLRANSRAAVASLADELPILPLFENLP